MGDIECCAWSSFGRSFLRIQPLTWYPKDSGGSLRLGARARVLTGYSQGTHRVLTGYSQGTLSAPSVGLAMRGTSLALVPRMVRMVRSLALDSVTRAGFFTFRLRAITHQPGGPTQSMRGHTVVL